MEIVPNDVKTSCVYFFKIQMHFNQAPIRDILTKTLR